MTWKDPGGGGGGGGVGGGGGGGRVGCVFIILMSPMVCVVRREKDLTFAKGLTYVRLCVRCFMYVIQSFLTTLGGKYYPFLQVSKLRGREVE